ncbi:cadherin-related tumor suppressor [Scaptodrosophila lebanonensis]|uniref:Protocadherin-16 n=1 Tax=Drosophila lebanonensis TaxID=7225 RepID=A0A6J2TZL8_DROLE|nr:cadherin-related tumor suppressor [Scaptodrosophila lebanonensis]
MEHAQVLLLLVLIATFVLSQTTHISKRLDLIPRGRSYATTYEQYAAFPRRRSSATNGEMQSRAVDTSAEFEVLEGQPRGITVGFLPTKPTFTYRFNEPPREFTLDQFSGEIKTNIVLDREGRSDHYDLVVLSSQPTYPIEVHIKVLDINDNSPEFPEPSIAVSFSESAAPGTRLLLDAATDADLGEAQEIVYEIIDGNYEHKFRLITTTNPSGDTSYLHLETTSNLDRESCGYYQLNISARDGGVPPRFGFLQVNVTILDQNDNPPIFDHSDYSVSLNETVKPGTPVLQVMASDSDLGDNSKLTYYLAENSQFTVDPETGVISTTEYLKCPQQTNPLSQDFIGKGQKSCVFTVFARDHGSPRQDGRTYVTVNLLDTNDHDPIIRFQYFPPTGSVATVDENAINGTVVAAVSADDSDDGVNGETTTQIVSGNELGHFRLEKTPLFHIVRVNGVLDREEISKYNLTVIVTDKGTPSRSTTAHLIIHVNDLNDHEPVFEKSEYSAVLSELTPTGTFVASITATDEDSGVNAQVFYEIISGNDLQWFNINEDTGLVVTSGPLDREVQGSVELSISARDGGPNPKYAYTQLKVTILDENDEAPRFSQNQLNISLSEDVEPLTIITILTATDNDQGANGSVSFALSQSVERMYPHQFAIDAITGQLTTRTSLDREKIPFYEIFVIARDHGTPAQQSATSTIHLSIIDVNDNSPAFYPRHYFHSLSDTAEFDRSSFQTVLLNVTAVDSDADEDNSLISYTLESGGEGIFQVDVSTGTVYFRNDLSPILKPYYKLQISARDPGGRRNVHDAIVEIVLQSKTGVLEFDTDGDYEYEIVEDHASHKAQLGREVGRVQLKSQQQQPFDFMLVEFDIIHGDSQEMFSIDRHNGLITTAKPLDREEQVHYHLVILARKRSDNNDNNMASAYGKCSVHITILDLNDNAPSFAHEHDFDDATAIWLPENAAVGQEIYLSRARDRDAGINSRINFNLTRNPNEQFRISTASGVLYLQQPVRAEPNTVLQVELQATDGGMPSLYSKLSLFVHIFDVNDHTPVFDHTSYETSLLETTKVNTRFFALAASDNDLGANGRISYEITEGNKEHMFGIFPDGYLFLRAPLDREERDYYALTIICQDAGTPSRSSVVPVTIHILDSNDNAPRFTNRTFVYSVSENMPMGTFVGKLTAVDRDIGHNAELIFALPNESLDFTIDSRSGFIKTLRPFDREALLRGQRGPENRAGSVDEDNGNNYLMLEVVVSDNGSPPLHDHANIKVIVSDVNDNAPQFLREPYHVTISEGATVGTHIMYLFTQDDDEGLNGDVFFMLIGGNESGQFSLDSATGQLTLARSLDRELNPSHKLLVEARDAAVIHPLSSNTTVFINVLDDNDNAPEFTQFISEISVLETTPQGSKLMYFTASDMDQGINSQVIYSITAGNRKDTFHIDRLSGSLYLHKPLDYEENSVYALNITASDCGVPTLSTTIIFTIQVVDENDNAPEFTNTAIVRQIQEGIPVKTPIVTVIADDPDSGLNGKVTYAISRQEPEPPGGRHFGINTQTGVIHTLREIDRESIDTFRLTVVATDQAQPPDSQLSTEKLVTVIVEDINDNPPIFVSMNAAIMPADGKLLRYGSGAYVMQVQARDADSSSNGLVTYEIVNSQQDIFRLQRNTGIITLNNNAVSKPELSYQLAIKATDEAVQSERKSTETYITIITLGGKEPDIPTFEQNSLFGSVYENEPIGTSILTVNAHLYEYQIEYFVTNVTAIGKKPESKASQVDRLFDIDTKLGILSTAAELDREAGFDTYEVEVHAIAVGGRPRSAKTSIIVSLLDRNDSPPTILNMPLIYNVSEELDIGGTIATISAYDPDSIGNISYAIMDGHDEKFALEPRTGTFLLKDGLDRETKSRYNIRIRVSDGVQFTQAHIIIDVTDINDNPPLFSDSVYSFDIPENAERGYQVGRIEASDNDLGANAQLSYTVISDWANDVFSLNPQTGVFTLTALLDYEEVQHYILIVQAQDNGIPSLSTTITVYCNVLDLNDNAPIFDPMSYSSEIFENVPIGITVVNVSAKDIDSGNNGLIEYSITDGDESNDFEIMSNGTIRTRRKIDRERRSSYTLTITARDCANDEAAFKGLEEARLKLKYRIPRKIQEQPSQLMVHQKQQRLSATVQVTILIKDINDEPPVFISANETKIMENVAINTIVMSVKAVDPDEGRNGYIDYILVEPSALLTDVESLPFTLNPTDGLLRVVDTLDRELCSSYTLNILARDRGEPPQSTQQQLLIKILDDNDNSPVFDPKQYSASVAENASIGAMVLQVSATDVDEGVNGQVRYTISAGDENHDFSISEDTGVIRVAKNLNYERTSRYILTVEAADCAIENDYLSLATDQRILSHVAHEARIDTAEVSISITDINDNSPTFLNSPYIAYVMENTIPPNGGYVLTVDAYDADTPPLNSQVRYFLKEGDADLFQINASTGNISLLKPLDRELQSEYILTLVAMDTGSPPLTGTGNVRVKVQDINDHSPTFERQSYYSSIQENLPIGTHVLQPIATDRDDGINAKIRFSLLGEHMEKFQIDSETCEITTASILDREKTAVYHLTLMAQDSSVIDPRATSVNLTITVTDINDNAPKFTSDHFDVVVPDKIHVGEFVFSAKALDLDEGPNGHVTYNISGDDYQYFAIDAVTGVLKLKLQLKRNGNIDSNIYNIKIHATDHGEVPLNSTAELTVVQRPTEFFPTFSYIPNTQLILPEDVLPTSTIAKLTAISPKKGAAGTIRYEISGGNNVGDSVRVDVKSGVLTVGEDGLDYELASELQLWVQAFDSDTPSLGSVVLLTINVTDTNDNAPVMEKLIYAAELLEEETPPQHVVTIKAIDKDSGNNGEISFRLQNDYDGTFEIDADSGEIYTTLRLDREQMSNYALIVEAVDQGLPQLTGTASVLLQLLDKNDNPPKFSRLFSLNVTENVEIGSFVITVTSSDLDLGPNANVTYTFSENPGHKFKIDQISGNITVAALLDRELQDEYVLKVVASDGAWRAETPITITILDQNDNAPEFEHSFYSYNFPELQRAGAIVGQIIATDRDKQGPNSVISYALHQPSHVFSIDPATGVLYSKKKIKYQYSQYGSSPENMYALTILATDNGKPPLNSECLVNINIVDANNNPPKFKQQYYLSPLPENSRPGQLIVCVSAVDNQDVGVNAEVDYSLVSANLSAYFVISKQDGCISLAKHLDVPENMYFLLTVTATDRGVPPLSDQTNVTIIVTGENRHMPVFTALSYQVIVPENEPIGSTILTVSATDNDDKNGPNGMLQYFISSGNERKEFEVDEHTGAITLLQSLDFDVIQEYHLNITAKDLGFRPKKAVALLTIILTDVNDNPPEFSESEYHSYIEENKPESTFVFHAHATDKDSPKNAIIYYSLSSGPDRNYFTINATTGVVSSATSFDYESRRRTYMLQIKASNPDSVMENYATLFVHVTGVNEYYPQFVQPVFHFDVSESSAIGSSVGAVQATDKDAGEDGHVYYLLVGSSNDKGFSINTHTGVLFVSRQLDREMQSRVVLTVMAKNYGSIRGNDTDEAQIIISIQDGNDPPEFIKHYYTAKISEDAPIGTRVTKVKAVDKDTRPQNSQFSYSIIDGNPMHSFKIDSQTGEIQTNRRLDREDISHYNLIIGAIDTGLPKQTGSTTVRIDLEDVNDNGPTFAAGGLLGYVMENELPGTLIMTLSASDPDLAPNGGPFIYKLVGGKHKSWLNINEQTGVVKSTVTFDREVTQTLEAIIEVEDNGKPPQRTQHTLTINILDQNDNPSTPRTVQVAVSVFNGELPPNTKVADVHPNDIDTAATYRCHIQESIGNDHLTIPNGCDLYTTAQTISTATYIYNIQGNDGKHSDVSSKVTVNFYAFDNNTLANTVVLLVKNVTAQQFLTQFHRSIIELINLRYGSDSKLSIYGLIDITSNGTGVEVLLAIRMANGTYHHPRFIIGYLEEKHSALVRLMQTEVIVGYEPCSVSNVCTNGGVCSSSIRVFDLQRLSIVDSPSFVLSNPQLAHDYSCQCAVGFAGEQCTRRQDPCNPNPCLAQAKCHRIGYDYQCICPNNLEGKQCQRERGDICLTKPCRNGGSCQISSDGKSFICLCRPGYRGSLCESISDSCRPNPCFHGGQCVSLKPGFKCTCTANRYGRHCERFSYGFEPLSYMTFPALDPTTNDISIVFATSKPNALLLYNYGIQNGGRSDFLAIELVRGQAYFSSGGIRTSITTVAVSNNVTDGNWHKVTATRNGRVMSLSVAHCTDSGDVCAECNPGDGTCFADVVGPVGTLNFNKQPLLIGGLASVDTVLQRHGQIHSDDFVGCIHSISINGRNLNLSTPLQQHRVVPGCHRQKGLCESSIAAERCGRYAVGQCSDRWSTLLCQCGGYLHSPDCGDSLQPITLTDGAYIEFNISEQHRRIQLLHNLYEGDGAVLSHSFRKRRYTPANNISTSFQIDELPKMMGLLFRTYKTEGLILYAATNQMFTSLSLHGGKLVYYSKQELIVNMTLQTAINLYDGKWHNVSLLAESHTLRLYIDGLQVGDDLDFSGVHDFFDPYLTMLTIGGVPKDILQVDTFVGCIANFSINSDVQPLNGFGNIFPEITHHGNVETGCRSDVGIDAAQIADPLSIGITLVIVFFVILVVAIFGSYIIYRFRGKQEKIGSLSCGVPGFKINHSGGVLSSSANVSQSPSDHGLTRGIHPNETDGTELVRQPAHQLVGPELITKKFKDRSELPLAAENSQSQHRPQRPDIIEREVVNKNPPIREEHHLSLAAPSTQVLHPLEHVNLDLSSDYPEHYDLENASSIAPSDIDIVYHYKGYRARGEAGGIRKYKTTSSPVTAYMHHKHQRPAGQQQHRHSPRHVVNAPFVSRVPTQGGQPPPPPGSASRTHQSTPLARLSPSSELSSQQPRILTLHDISGKPLQSALLATTSSSGGKDALHSNSERSLNSPVMSQLSGQSSSASHQKSVAAQQPPPSQTTMGLTAEEIERLNTRPRTSSLVSTLDAVSLSSEAPRVSNGALHLSLGSGLHSTDVDAHSSSSTDESGNDSFTCSEIEYDNNSLSGDGKYSTSKSILDGCSPAGRAMPNDPARNSNVGKTPPAPPHSYDGFDSSFRGSLSTLVASDDELANHLNGIYRKANVAASPPETNLGWEYFINWGPSYENLMGVFKDITELSETASQQQQQTPSTIRPPNAQKTPEEYV